MDPASLAGVTVEAAASAERGSIRTGEVTDLFADWTAAVALDGAGGGTAYAQIVGDPPSIGSRVALLDDPSGVTIIVGGWSGSRRLLGWTEVTVDQAGIGAEADIDDAVVEFTVTQPGRLIGIACHLRVVPTSTAGRDVTIKAYDDSTLLGRVAQGPVLAKAVMDGLLIVGTNGDPVDTGDMEWKLTGQCEGGGSMTVTSSDERTTVAVYDLGPA